MLVAIVTGIDVECRHHIEPLYPIGSKLEAGLGRQAEEVVAMDGVHPVFLDKMGLQQLLKNKMP